jgi:Matrixin/Cobalamin-independent synthase, Catalytic domain
MTLPLFPVTTVGSWPRPPRVAEAMRAYRHRRIERAERDRVADEAVLELLRLQERLGCDIVTDGELRRDNFYSFVADKVSGVRLMTLAEMLEVVEDKAGFEQLLQTLDVPAYSISSPVCTARITRREPLTVDDLAFARRHTDLPIKVTLPGPYLLTRAMFVPEFMWSIGAVAGAFDVETVALHELGHIIGLAHSSVNGSVMFPTVADNFTKRVLTQDDISGALSLYPHQSNWRWCHKCQGLFFAGNPNPKCPAGGAHENVGSGLYILAHNLPPTSGWQSDWRWCNKCQGLFFGGNPNPKCPAGGAHDKAGSGNYSLIHNAGLAPGQQSDWRWCNKCQGLFFGGNPNPVCPAGGGHVKVGSGNYSLIHR